MITVCIALLFTIESVISLEVTDLLNKTSGNCIKDNGIWSSWNEWSMCSTSCGFEGLRYRRRKCLKEGCLIEVDEKKENCKRIECPQKLDYYTDKWHCVFNPPVNGGWSNWAVEHDCTNVCADRMKYSSRQCDSPNPRFCGNSCGEENLKLEVCPEVPFVIEFRHDTTTNIPTVYNIDFPETNEISVCFWFKVNAYYNHKNALMTYVTDDLGENDFAVWFDIKRMYVYKRDTITYVLDEHPVNTWIHFCWIWDSTGNWMTYINGTAHQSNTAQGAEFKKKFQATKGYLLLGQDTDLVNSEELIDDVEQMFVGKITEFYIYHVKLTAEDVSSAFTHSPMKENIVVGWQMFVGKANSTDIVELESPF